MGYPVKFPYNAWYVAARGEEVAAGLLGRQILGLPMVLFRGETGEAFALEDRCPHRQLPLSMGKMCEGGEIECAYHGLRFDASGACVAIPSQDTIPSRMQARSYPVVERGPLVWLWPGDAAQADADQIPDYGFVDDDGCVSMEGTMYVAARAQLFNENLLDLSHLTTLHPNSVGSESISRAPETVRSDATSVFVERDMRDIESFPMIRGLLGTERIDSSQIAEWRAPGFNVSHAVITPLDVDVKPLIFRVIHCVTPETDSTTHDFWVTCTFNMPMRPGHEAMARAIVEQTINEDIAAAEAIERTLQATGDSQISVRADRGALKSREILEQLVAQERLTPSGRPSAA